MWWGLFFNFIYPILYFHTAEIGSQRRTGACRAVTYPPKGSAKELPWGPFSSFLSCCSTSEPKFGFHFHWQSNFLKLIFFIPQRGVRNHSRKVRLISFSNYYCHTVEKNWSFNYGLVIVQFFLSKIFFPQREVLQLSRGVQFISFPIIIVIPWMKIEVSILK